MTITWFNKVSQPIMIPCAPGRPPRPFNHERLEVRDDHTQDILLIYQGIMDTAGSNIDDEFVEEDNP